MKPKKKFFGVLVVTIAIAILLTVSVHSSTPRLDLGWNFPIISSPVISASDGENNITDQISRGIGATVPKPGTLLLLGLGLMGVAIYRRLKNK